MSESRSNHTTGEAALRPEIGVFLGVLLVINATIGTGIFKTPASVARNAGSLSAALGVWVVGGVLALCGTLSLAELSAAMPRAGGLYEILRRAWGERVAFLYGWAKLTLLIPSAAGSIAKLAAEALASLLGWPPDPVRDARVSVGILLLCAGANVMGVRASALQQGVVTLAKYFGVLLLAAAGLFLAAKTTVPSLAGTTLKYASEPTMTGCFAALLSVMWAYDGWADLASLSAEVRNPGRTLPRALIAGTAAIVVVYLAANFGYARTLGLDGLRGATTGPNMAAARLVTVTLGDGGRQFLAVLILISCVGGCMSSLMTGPRIFIPMATDQVFIGWLGAVSPRSGSPVRAVVVSALLGAVFVVFRSFEQLTDAFVVGYFLFYMLAVAAVFRLRQLEPKLPRPFLVPGFPVVPLIFLAGGCALLEGAFSTGDRTAFYAAGVLMAGLPVYELRRRARAKEPAVDWSPGG